MLLALFGVFLDKIIEIVLVVSSGVPLVKNSRHCLGHGRRTRNSAATAVAAPASVLPGDRIAARYTFDSRLFTWESLAISRNSTVIDVCSVIFLKICGMQITTDASVLAAVVPTPSLVYAPTKAGAFFCASSFPQPLRFEGNGRQGSSSRRRSSNRFGRSGARTWPGRGDPTRNRGRWTPWGGATPWFRRFGTAFADATNKPVSRFLPGGGVTGAATNASFARKHAPAARWPGRDVAAPAGARQPRAIACGSNVARFVASFFEQEP